MRRVCKIAHNISGKNWMILVAVIAMLFSSFSLNAQLFPGLEGDDLIHAIQNEFTPSVLLNETQVKDTLYAKIFIEGDSIHCIYSDLAHDLPPGVDPSQWIYENGTETNSMNLEHGWPQAKGASEGKPGNRDMHHLYPSRSAINSDRGDFPFAEITDNTTQKWYHLGIETSVKPTSNINAYSEFKSGAFEPKEDVKGDIARAMFYFWTIYHDDAIEADPLFFSLMQQDICTWHEADPVDSFEMMRTQRIAQYQDGKANPFVLDCSLAQRTYCSNLQPCDMVAVESVDMEKDFEFSISEGSLIVIGKAGDSYYLLITDILGKKIFEGEMTEGQKINLSGLAPGILYLTGHTNGRQFFQKGLFLMP